MPEPIKAERTIKRIVEGTDTPKKKPAVITFEDGFIAKTWSTTFGSPLEIGVTAECVTTEKVFGDYVDNWLDQWGAPVAKPKGKGGGGGWTPAPKTPEEIHAEPIAQIVSALIAAKVDVEDAGKWLKVYRAAVTGMSKPPQAVPA